MAAAEQDPGLAAAPPFVSYSSCTEIVVPAADWEALYASLQALKGHVQEYPGCQRFDVFVRAQTDGVRIHVYTTWDTLDQLEVYEQRGYTFTRLLADFGDTAPERELIMEKIF
jgi:quinol monooxygenase YgiN